MTAERLPTYDGPSIQMSAIKNHGETVILSCKTQGKIYPCEVIISYVSRHSKDTLHSPNNTCLLLDMIF